MHADLTLPAGLYTICYQVATENTNARWEWWGTTRPLVVYGVMTGFPQSKATTVGVPALFFVWGVLPLIVDSILFGLVQTQ